MGSLQFLHRPRSSRYEMRGKLSLGRIGSPQLGQWDAGHTIDSRRGTRWITTLRKLPTTSPKSTATKIVKPCSREASPSGESLLRPYDESVSVRGTRTPQQRPVARRRPPSPPAS